MSWFSVGSLHVEVGQYIDGLAAVMIVVVTAVSLSVHVYSLGYMDGDVRFTWFYVVLSLFTAAMLNVVIAPNLIQLLVGWEIMGVCSYLLIGHWYEVKENSNAAIKAFITTRIGDVPMLFGIFALIFATGFTTSNITAIGDLVASHQVSSGLVAAAALLLFGGTIGKSAQFPLHVWLPDAMAGPTPVSALIHAATMVAAGVYLVGRMYTVFINAEPGCCRSSASSGRSPCSAPRSWRSSRRTSNGCWRTPRCPSSPTWSRPCRSDRPAATPRSSTCSRTRSSRRCSSWARAP